MKFAQVTLGLLPNRLFDYSIPDNLKNIYPGSRVLIDFAGRKTIGYIASLKNTTTIKKVKPIIGLIDKIPLITPNLLEFTKEMAQYYNCSWGQMIESALPKALRSAKELDIQYNNIPQNIRNKTEITVVFNFNKDSRFKLYLDKIKPIISNNQQVIIIFPDLDSAIDFKNSIPCELNDKVCLLSRYLKTKDSLDTFKQILEVKTKIILGTMSAIFAPCSNLGLIIVDQEDSSIYKQDQTPFYHVRHSAILRSKIEKCPLILASRTISLETYVLAKAKKTKLLHIEGTDYPTIELFDTTREFYRVKKGAIFSSRLENEINSIVAKQENIGIFINKRGYATMIKCGSCGFILKCQRCNVNLVYDFKLKVAYCRHCNFKINILELCPNCKKSYLNYSGFGAEKLESYLHNIFPHLKISSDYNKNKNANIFILDNKIVKQQIKLDNIAIISADILLNLSDYGSAEKTFSLINSLIDLAKNKLFIETLMPHHYVWQAIKKNDPELFYKKELILRKELKFPPFWSFIQLVLRGKNKEKIEAKCQNLFDLLKDSAPLDTVIYPPQEAMPSKLRGNFRYQILLKTKNVLSTNQFLRNKLDKRSFSNMILTINVNP